MHSGYDFINEDELLFQLLKLRGVEDPKTFLNLSEKHIHDGMLMLGMREGLELLHQHIEEGNDIHVQVDSDADGNTSAAFMIKYIKKVNKKAKITYSIHTGKEHGIVLDLLKDYKFDLLIVPDAGSNDVEQCKTLKNKGIDVLILDHHDIDEVNNHAILINCKDGQYPNPTLSGCGVVYKYCKEYDKLYKFNFADSMLCLVTLGTVADSMDLRNYETRYLTLKGLKTFGSNSLLDEIIKKNEYQIQDSINITKVGWYIAPYINGCIRSGENEDKLNMFRSLLEEEEIMEYKPSRKTKDNPEKNIIKQNLQEFMARELARIKSKQDTIVKKGVAELVEKITEKKLDENKILMVDATGILDSTYTGLVANKLTNLYKRPVLLLRKAWGDTYGGSGRNYNLSPIVDFREFLQGLETFNYIRGHGNAFGMNIDTDNLIVTRDKANEALKDMVIEDVYKVDYEIPIGRLKPSHIKQVGEWEDLWGNRLDEPLFAITNIFIPVERIEMMGAKKNMIKFESKGITFIKRFTNEDTYNQMILKQTRGLNKKKVKSVKIDVVGKFKLNRYEQYVSPQVEIVDFNSVEENNFIF